MPEVSKTEIGRRYFKMQKEKQVEKAIEKIRLAQGSEWSLFAHQDIESLKTILAEVWVYIDRDSWETIPFAQISGIELRELIQLGKDITDNSTIGRAAAEKSMSVLMKHKP